MPTTKPTTAANVDDLKVSNTVIREVMGAKLPIQNFEASYTGGTLVMRGTVADAATRAKAVAIANGTAGVRRVEDRMTTGTAAGPIGMGGARSYTVKKGDTLSEIAQRELGAASRWKEIFEANKGTLTDPDEIKPGQVLRLP